MIRPPANKLKEWAGFYIARERDIAMNDLKDVQVFVTAAKKRSVREAAVALAVPPSTISRAITRLEKTSGLLLLERSRRGIRLTDAGREYLRFCQEAMLRLRDGEDYLRNHRENPEGKLSIGMPTTFAREMVLPFIRKFMDSYPDLRLRFVLHECDHPKPPEDVDLDIFFQAGRPTESDWRVKAFPPVRMCLAASPEYLRRAGTPQCPEDLPKYRFVSWGPGGNSLVLELRSNRKKKSIEVPLAISITHASLQNQLAQQGLGIGYVQLWEAQPALENGNLELVLPEWEPQPVPFYALYRQRSSMMPKIEAFMKSVGRYIATEHDPRRRGSERGRYFAHNDDTTRYPPREDELAAD